MTDETRPRAAPQPCTPTPLRIRLPGFITEEEIGLGDVLKRAAYTVGLKPCGGCDRRAAVLNRRVVFHR